MSQKIAALITDDVADSPFISPADAYRLAGHKVVAIEKQAGKKEKPLSTTSRGNQQNPGRSAGV